MKFSLITPTHKVENIPFLLELYESIVEQSYQNWEWVLYISGALSIYDIPEKIKQNNKVSIYINECKDIEQPIGKIKKEAFLLGTGDILVEVDHDDILVDNCLQELYNVYSTKHDIGFVYSDDAVYCMNNTFIPFSKQHGWTYRTFIWKNKELIAMNSFSPTSHSFSYIYYAPDHVRSWRRTTYLKLGGHNPNLAISDDIELLQRTYARTGVYHIPKVLYIYRMHDNNTWPQKADKIKKLSRSLFDTHIRSLAEKDANKKGLLKIDIGGAKGRYSPEYKVIDIEKSADIVADLNIGIPLSDNSVGVVNAHHILEHLKDPILSMQEIHRVLCHGGWAFIEVPSTDGRGAWQDPTHVSFWNINSFWYYTNKKYAHFISNNNIRFQIYKLTDYYPSPFHKKHNIVVTCAVLVAIKNNEERFPGLLHI
jgi:glycosyltransferase involved in cell wall biosynthesis